jgi:hypothetical protein
VDRLAIKSQLLGELASEMRGRAAQDRRSKYAPQPAPQPVAAANPAPAEPESDPEADLAGLDDAAIAQLVGAE